MWNRIIQCACLYSSLGFQMDIFQVYSLGITAKGGTTNLKGVNALEGGGGGQYSKNTQIWKRWGVHDPSSSYGGAAPNNSYIFLLLCKVIYYNVLLRLLA